ncbi:MAG: DUF4339 domain-containing protein [Tepidisphaeraceae bacterium]|jgi:hypothetical protein
MPHWHYFSDGEKVGPLDDEAVRLLLAEGRLSPDGLVQRDDWTECRPLRDVPELAADPAAPSTPAVPVLDYESRTDIKYNAEGRFHAIVSGLAAALCIILLAAPSYGSAFQTMSALAAFAAGRKALTVMRDNGTTQDRFLAFAGTFGGIIGLVCRIVLWCIHYFR